MSATPTILPELINATETDENNEDDTSVLALENSRSNSEDNATGAIRPLDTTSVHRITSGQVIVDLQSAIKELLENSLDAGASSVEVRFNDHGVNSFDVIDNGSGVRPEDYEAVGLKHHTSKLKAFTDLTSLSTFGFRGEALASLCALCESVTITTATAEQAPKGTILELDRTGRVKNQRTVARQRGTTVTATDLFASLPVRRKELQRNAKREYGKALTLLTAYALVPCSKPYRNSPRKGVRLTVSNHLAGGRKTVQLRTDGTPSIRAAISSVWGPKALEHLVELDLKFDVKIDKAARRLSGEANVVHVRGLISRFAVGSGRAGSDRQFFFVNGRPCNPGKVQKAINEVYRTFNANQTPFVVADFIIPTDACDVNVSPDKRTIFLHSEDNLVSALKISLEETFASARATYDVNVKVGTGTANTPLAADKLRGTASTQLERKAATPLFLQDDDDQGNSSEEHDDANNTAASRIEPGSDEPSNSGDVVVSPAFGTPNSLLPSRTNSVHSFTETHSPTAPSEPDIITKTSSGELAGGVSFQPMDVEDDMPSYIVQIPAPRSRYNSRSKSGSSRSSSMAAGSSVTHTLTQMQKAAIPHPTSPTVDQSDVITTFARRSEMSIRTKDTTKSVQATLSTANASWQLRPRDESEEQPQKKKARLDSTASRKQGKDARTQMRGWLKNFASQGAAPDDDAATVDEDEDLATTDEDVDAPESVDPARRSVIEREGGQADESISEVEQYEVAEADADTTSERHPQEEVIDLTQDSHDVTTSDNLLVSSEFEYDTSTSRLTEVVRTDNDEITLQFSLARVVASWGRLQRHLSASKNSASPSLTQSAGSSEDVGPANMQDEAAAEESLSRTIQKDDFSAMDVVGQFNLGFIIARRRKTPDHGEVGRPTVMDDLFIVDQHAADEKYNFETLQQTTKIESQKLYSPQPLELTAADVLLATENMDLLRHNGFEVEVDDDVAAGSGCRMKLVAQPVSKSTVFDVKDLEELLHLMQDRPAGKMIRCSKARAMFAMRACRKSVMIGKSLNKTQMTSILRHMGTMDQPWHCPHGRPTMRHLSDITQVIRMRQKTQEAREVDWTAFADA